MSGAHSISTRRAYGVQRICRVWERARGPHGGAARSGIGPEGANRASRS